MTRTSFLSLEIRYCVSHFRRTDDESVESFDNADEAEAHYLRMAEYNPPAAQFVSLYARVPDEDREALPMGLLECIGDFTDYEAATRMLDLLSGTTREERAAAGDPDRYVPGNGGGATAETFIVLHDWESNQSAPSTYVHLSRDAAEATIRELWGEHAEQRDMPADSPMPAPTLDGSTWLYQFDSQEWCWLQGPQKLPELHVPTNGQAIPGGGNGGGNAARPLADQPKPGDPDQSLMEAACCIWEAMLTAGQWGQTGPLDPPENHALAKAFEDYGTSEMRLTAINLVSHCHACWESLPEEDRYNDPFDWEFVPAYVALADWSSGSPQWPYPTPEEIGRAVLAKMQKREAA